METVHTVALAGFNTGAAVYDKARPTYPAVAVDHIVTKSNLDGNSTIMDVGAGTGKLTTLLCAHSQLRGASVIAVEPTEGMKDILVTNCPGATVIQAAASSIPVNDNTADCIVVAQAFHWFATRESLMEFHRILKPGRNLVLIWNMEDDAAVWIAKLKDVYQQYDSGVPQFRKSDLWRKCIDEDSERPDRLFDTLVLDQFHWETEDQTTEQVWERVQSRSYISTLVKEEQQKLKTTVLGILEGQQLWKTPYVTSVYVLKAL